MSLIIRGFCAIFCVSQSVQPMAQQQLPAPAHHHIDSRQTSAQLRSPCPEYFQYQVDSWTKETRGVLSIPPPQDSTTINVNVELVVNARIGPNDFTGRLDLAEDKDRVIQRLRQGNRNPIKYNVVFPVQNPTPVLTNLVVNRQSICSFNPGTTYGYITNLKLDHSLVSPVPIVFNSNSYPETGGGFNQFPSQSGSFNQPSRPQPVTNPPAIEVQNHFNEGFNQPRPTQRPTTSSTNPPTIWTRPTTERPTQSQFQEPQQSGPSSLEKFQECGVSTQVSNLVVNGDSVAKGAWPWLSAIYDVTGTGVSFICGGTLVTNRHVITAAHCVVVTQGRATLKKPENVVIYLGKYNIVSVFEQDAIAKEISDITAHPQYTGKLESAGVDLAILTFVSTQAFGPNIRPVCMWDPSKQYSQSGKVVGWGRDEYGNAVSKTPKQADMPIVTNEECLRANPDFIQITSETTFCAGSRDGSGPCKGDSGGGLYVWNHNTKRWAIRGVVSQSLWDNNLNSCDLKNYVTFTDVSKLMPWVNQMTRR